MKRNRTQLGLATGVLVLLLGGAALAQTTGALDLQQGNAFAPADLSGYGSRPEPNQGYFFSAEYLNWSCSEPKKKYIGSDSGRFVVTDVVQIVIAPPYDPTFDYRVVEGYVQESALTTDFIGAEFESGMRYELGRVSGHHGWMVSTYHIRPTDQTVAFDHVPVTFDDPSSLLTGVVGTYQQVVGVLPAPPPFGTPIIALVREDGNIGIQYDRLTAHDRFKTWSVEAAYIYRMHRNHFRAPRYLKPARALERVFDGSLFEWYVGARYQEFHGRFLVEGFGGTLGDSYWDTRAKNNIIGPMLGVRWTQEHQRVKFSLEGRFIAGFNRQNFYQEGMLGSNVVVGGTGQLAAWPGTPFTHQTHNDEFSPMVELRVELAYKVTRALSLRAGWNGTYVDHIARASSVINYQVPRMGIDQSSYDQGLFMHGVSVGAVINR